MKKKWRLVERYKASQIIDIYCPSCESVEPHESKDEKVTCQSCDWTRVLTVK